MSLPVKLVAASSLLSLLSGVAARAEDQANTNVPEVVVTADPAGLTERAAQDTIFGLKKPLLDTPRQASLASAATLDRYGVQSINDLVAVAPGTYTDSYYGVAGAVNLRGSLAETYFRGFKRIEDRGTYPTPLGAADRIEIVRGPASPVDGPSKVGGFLNFTPKSARIDQGFVSRAHGDLEASAGAYGAWKTDGGVALPASVAGHAGGVYLYGEAEDAGNYYRGVRPQHQLAQASSDFDLGHGLSFTADAMVYHSDGTVQTPGWNRVTQALIDHGTYQTGRNTVLQDLNHNGRLDHNEADAGAYPGAGLIGYYFGFTPTVDPRFQLNTGVGSAHLSPRTVFVSGADFSRTNTRTLYTALTQSLVGGDTLKLELFYDDLDNRRFVSYGFPANYQAFAAEGRLTYAFKRTLGEINADSITGASLRTYQGAQKESFNSGYLAPDRRDLAFGPTATDILIDPFTNPSLGWETDVRSRWTDAGLFALTDLSWRKLDLILGGRYDAYSVSSHDAGTLVYGPSRGHTDKGEFSYTASLTWHAPLGLMPYVTRAETGALELGQAGGVAPNLIVAHNWISHSNLSEAGIKGRALDGRFTGSLGLYRQERTQLGQNNVVVGTRGEGAELELRWIASRSLSFTFAGDLQRTVIKGPDPSFMLVPPSRVGLSGANAYGGAYAVFAMSMIRPGSYTDSLIPHGTASLFAVYTSPDQGWGRYGATAGATYVGRTASTIPGVFVLPDYVKANLSGFVEHGSWRLSANVDNLFDQRYFTPVADVLSNVAVLPGVGRTWRVTLRRSF